MKKNKFAACAAVLSAAALTFAGGCGGLNPNETAATLNGRAISLGLMNFAAQSEAVMYDAYYMPYYGTDMWTQDQGDGVTMANDVLDEVVVKVKREYLLDEHMADYGVTISDQELSAIDAAVEEFFAENSDEAIKKMGASKEVVREFLRLELVEKKTGDAIKATADTTVTDEEAAQRTFSYYRIELPEAESTDDEEADKVALDALAATIATAAKADFDSVADEYGQTVLTYSYGEDEESFDEKVIEAADALAEGEVSDLIKTDNDFYYVIRLDKEFDQEATDSRKEELAEEKKDEKLEEVISGYEEAASWTPNDAVIGKINFNNYYKMVYDETTEAAETAG